MGGGGGAQRIGAEKASVREMKNGFAAASATPCGARNRAASATTVAET